MIVESISKSFPGVPVLITGDLIDSAAKDEFIAALNLMDRLAITNPILMVPGNHEYAWKGNVYMPGAWKGWLRYLGSPMGWDLKAPNWLEKSHDPVGVDGLGIWKHDSVVFLV
jgi:hypothetical protein